MQSNVFFRTWLSYAITITVMAGMAYGVGQFILRSSANDPQLQIARDVAQQISCVGGKLEPARFATEDKVLMRDSLSSFLMIFDSDNKVLVSNGEINADPTDVKIMSDVSVPVEVLEYARQHLEHRVTLQATPKVRLAAVFVQSPVCGPGAIDSRVVMVARNLNEVESRIQSTMLFVGAAWLVGLIATAGGAYIVTLHPQK